MKKCARCRALPSRRVSRSVPKLAPHLREKPASAREHKAASEYRRKEWHHPCHISVSAAASGRRQAPGSNRARQSRLLWREPVGTRASSVRPAASATTAAAKALHPPAHATEVLLARIA